VIELVAAYSSEDALLVAIAELRRGGCELVEVYTPHPLSGQQPRTGLSAIAGCAGLAGAIAGYAGQWLIAAYLYPVDSGGRPPHMPLAFVPIALELGFLAAAVAVAIALFVQARLGTLWEPLDELPHADWRLVVRGNDPIALRTLLAETGALWVGGER
jgi:hypothetical protein